MALLDEIFDLNPVMLLGAGVVATALPQLLPGMRPGVVAAIRIGLDLFTESEAEAEAEVVHALVETTLSALRGEMAKPLSRNEKRAAVIHHIRQFKKRAAKRSHRWTGDQSRRAHLYRRHLTSLGTRMKAHPALSAAHEAIAEALGEPVESPGVGAPGHAPQSKRQQA